MRKPVLGGSDLVRILDTNKHDYVGKEDESHDGHYENTPMQYTAIFDGCKNYNFKLIFFYYFHIFAQNIYCGYTLEPPH